MFSARPKGFLWTLLAVAVLGCSSGEAEETADNDNAKGEAGSAVAEDTETLLGGVPLGCTAESAWVTAPSEPDPGAFSPNSQCSFHQWSYQNFLWLTSPDPGTGQTIFEGFANPNKLFVQGGPSEPYPGRGGPEPTRMLARLEKSGTSADIEDIFQAGPGGKILVDQNGEVVFYSNHLNEVFWDFIVKNSLYDLATLKATKGPALNFAQGALELKASWRVAKKGEKVLIEDADSRFHVVDTVIPTVTVDAAGHIKEDWAKSIPARMALIGFHIAGTVKGHPEFIWATFEHVDNAPVAASDPSKAAASGPGPTGPWSLYKPGTPTGACNQFDSGNPLAVVNICLENPQGGGDADNKEAVKTLNANVASIPPTAPWGNYMLGGAVWTDGTVPLNNGAFAPGASPPATQLGSLALANTSMETFTQQDNCFACHNGGAHEIAVDSGSTEVNAKSVNLSHFVVNYQAVEQVKAEK